MVLAAIVLLLAGGERDTGAERVPSAAPVLELLRPVSGASVEGPLRIEFRLPVPLELAPDGWGAADLHLHLELDGREYMPSPRDIQPLGGSEYRWSMPALPAGEHTLRLFWAGPDHAAMEEGASERVTVSAR